MQRRAIKTILALIKSELGHLPQTLVYRIHSDKGGEFLGEELKQYVLFHSIILQHKGTTHPVTVQRRMQWVCSRGALVFLLILIAFLPTGGESQY